MEKHKEVIKNSKSIYVVVTQDIQTAKFFRCSLHISKLDFMIYLS